GPSPREDTNMARLLAAFLAAAWFPTTAGAADPAAQGGPPPGPTFSRHVVPLFSRLGCNAGVCHRAGKGQKGFRLSLFGADPALDHVRVVREYAGRRLDPTDPDASLLLLKATARVPHEGGKRLEVGSPEYQTLRDWVARGAVLDQGESSRVVGLT